MSCVFRATGFDFDVDEFLRQNPVATDKVWRKGERKNAKRVHEWSGLTMIASESDVPHPEGKVDDAIAFLKENQAVLGRLRDFPDVQDLRLDFLIHDRDNAVQSDLFPADLLVLAGNLGIGIEVTRFN